MANWISGLLMGAGAAVSAYGTLSAGASAEEYYTRLAEIERINAEINRANTELSLSEREARAAWTLEAEKIDLANQQYTTDYKTIVAENERAFNDYMAALTRRQAAEYLDVARGDFEGEKAIAEKTEILKQTEAKQAYDEKMDTLRHVVAETTAKGAKGGFKIDAGSFMSALRDQTAVGDYYLTGSREAAEEAARINKEAGLLSADTQFQQRRLTAEGMEGQAQRFDLGSKINLEEIKLAQALYGSAAQKYGIAEETYGFITDQAGQLRILNEQSYGSSMQRAAVTEKQGRDARSGSYWAAGGSLLSAFGKAYYGMK